LSQKFLARLQIGCAFVVKHCFEFFNCKGFRGGLDSLEGFRKGLDSLEGFGYLIVNEYVREISWLFNNFSGGDVYQTFKV